MALSPGEYQSIVDLREAASQLADRARILAGYLDDVCRRTDPANEWNQNLTYAEARAIFFDRYVGYVMECEGALALLPRSLRSR